MYCAINKNGDIVGYNEDYDVVYDYIHNLNKSKEDDDCNLKIVKIKNKKFNKIPGLDDLYLVRYKSTYIQSGYILYLQLVSGEIAEDNVYVKDILLRVLEVYDLSNKESKIICKAIKVLDKIIEDEGSYTPSLKELNIYKNEYEPYIQKII